MFLYDQKYHQKNCSYLIECLGLQDLLEESERGKVEYQHPMHFHLANNQVGRGILLDCQKNCILDNQEYVLIGSFKVEYC